MREIPKMKFSQLKSDLQELLLWLITAWLKTNPGIIEEILKEAKLENVEIKSNEEIIDAIIYLNDGGWVKPNVERVKDGFFISMLVYDYGIDKYRPVGTATISSKSH